MDISKNILAWRVFLSVVRTGSISQTSLELDLELSKASRLLLDLERDLGCALFDRTRRPILPTDAGAEIAAEVGPHVEAFVRLERRLRGEADPFVVRFTAPADLTCLFFGPMLRAYAKRSPGFEFVLYRELALEKFAATDEADLAVLNCELCDDEGLVLRPYSRGSAVPVATPEYLRRCGTPECPEELAEHAGLLLSGVNQTPTECLWREGVPSAPLRWKSECREHEQLVLKRRMLDHEGVAVDIYLGHLVEELRTGAVVPLMRGWERRRWHMAVATRLEDEICEPRLRALADWLAIRARDQAEALDAAGRRETALAYWRTLQSGSGVHVR